MRSNRAGYNGSSYKRNVNSYGRNTSVNNRSYSRNSAAPVRRNSSPYRSGYTRASYTGALRSSRTVGSREYGYYRSSYSQYNNSSVARDFYYDQVPVYKSKKRVKRNEKEIVQLNMPKTIASIAIVFTLSLALLCSYAVNSSYREEISSKQAELAEIQEENQYLQTTLEDNIDLNKIAREAEKLGLQKPQAYQITEVEVPNESYTVQYDTKIATQDKSVWEFLKSLLSK